MKRDYMTRLERAARWRLPPKEADDVIADYREMVGDPPRPEGDLLRELGRPRDAIRSLVQTKQYRIWLAVFCVMSACILTQGISPTSIGYPIWRIYFYGYLARIVGYTVVVLGAVTALIWFRWQGRKADRLPKAIPILLAVLLACCGGVLLFCWACARDFEGFLVMWGTYEPWIGPNDSASVSFYVPLDIMVYGSFAISLAGVAWLVKARTVDRRWAAVYILALAAILAALSVVAAATSMDVPISITPEEIFRQQLLESAGIIAIGTIGAGVALC